MTQFLVEAAVLSGLGGLIGIAIGYGGSLLIGKAMYDLILVPDTMYVVASAIFSIVIGISLRDVSGCQGLRTAAGGRPARRLKTKGG